MNPRLKASDVYGVAGYTRDQFRGLIHELNFTFEDVATTRARVARTFSPRDFLLLLIACDLDRRVGLKRNVISALLPAMAQELARPRPTAANPKLVLTLDPPSAHYEDGATAIEDGIVLSLGKVFALADGHLQKRGDCFQSSQSQFEFGPALIKSAPTATAFALDSPRRSRR